jgi:hypothetical protein
MNECFICFTNNGIINDKEYKYLFFLNNNNYKNISYPLISLSNVYNCKCHNSYAHNNCLKNIYKCPTCRKGVIKPNIVIYDICNKHETDYYLLKIFVENPKYIKIFEKINLTIFNISLLTLFINSIIVYINEYFIQYKNIYTLNFYTTYKVKNEERYILYLYYVQFIIFLLLFSQKNLSVLDKIYKYMLFDDLKNNFY